VSVDTQRFDMREVILDRIATILQDVYEESIQEYSETYITAKLAFKSDPQLNELRLALERINRGEYGRCIFCKGDIDHDLLMRSPTAHFCEQCANVLRYRTTAQA